MADLKLIPPDLKENVIAVTALARLRRDVAFRITELEKRTEAARADLVHIDAVIRMLAPTFDPTAIAERKRHPRRLEYFSHGEISRRCFDAMRDGATVQAVDVTRQAMLDKGLSFEGDRRTRLEFTKRITMQLASMAKKGSVIRVGVGRGVRWKLPTVEPDLL